MPFLDKQQRELVKKTLSDVLTDKELKDQFNSAQKRKAEPLSDSAQAQLSQYTGVLKEIMDERAARPSIPDADARASDRSVVNDIVKRLNEIVYSFDPKGPENAGFKRRVTKNIAILRNVSQSLDPGNPKIVRTNRQIERGLESIRSALRGIKR